MKREQSGFTLIEVMVAIALMAIVSIIAWRGLENVSSMRRRLAADAEDIDVIVRMLGQMERDVSLRAPDNLLDTTTLPVAGGTDTSAQPATGTSSTSGTTSTSSTTTSTSSTTAGTTGTTTITLPPPVLPQSIRVISDGNTNANVSVELIRADAAFPGAWQRVVWFLDDTTLRRAVGASARQYPLPPTGRGAAIMSSVQRFTVRGWIPGQGWIATPFPTSGTPITGLELSVDRAVPGGVERYSRVVAFQ